MNIGSKINLNVFYHDFEFASLQEFLYGCSMRRVVKVVLGDCQEVLNELNQCLELYPEDGFYMLERGVLKTYMNKFKDAMVDFNCAFKILGETYEVMKHRAYVEHLLGDDKTTRILVVKPNNSSQ